MKRFKERGAFAIAVLVVVGFFDFRFCSLMLGGFLAIFLGAWLTLMSLFGVL
ncbi:hypothetical protein L934_08520 [Helicobacter pylori PZ5080]|uniref:Uncharacterized protein n=1 Tax=Helicobacter pylori PZ5080 TaxID=1337394 RepID=T2SJT1_HELPX|nr:hypothetical protein L934_08520 [Helicobacter pylori PZ5080]